MFIIRTSIACSQKSCHVEGKKSLKSFKKKDSINLSKMGKVIILGSLKTEPIVCEFECNGIFKIQRKFSNQQPSANAEVVGGLL